METAAEKRHIGRLHETAVRLQPLLWQADLKKSYLDLIEKKITIQKDLVSVTVSPPKKTWKPCQCLIKKENRFRLLRFFGLGTNTSLAKVEQAQLLHYVAEALNITPLTGGFTL